MERDHRACVVCPSPSLPLFVSTLENAAIRKKTAKMETFNVVGGSTLSSNSHASPKKFDQRKTLTIAFVQFISTSLYLVLPPHAPAAPEEHP
jgi:hypothetical protein